ncbi:MFS transporter [Alphaproteobacteria bacterium]|nr:MFS transporter [Alphaproteobacteria bacterium]MDB2668766.1 MFS transporter [Alphaproteobacteria bacterium]MDC0131621.1 MFS transporter [Alphaproteobacteria bacterium]MDC0147899.1 MFS transporter [Alphaproteobacteria bacterium]
MTQESERSATPRIPPLAAYLGGVGSWFASLGLQFVVMPTLAIITLETSANELAIVQMMFSIPQLFLLLYAGSVADRSNARHVLMILHGLAALPIAALGWLVYYDALSFWHLIMFAITMGILSAFVAPTRDGVLTRVTNKNIQSAVMMALVTQFIAQLSGFVLAGLAAPIAGPWALLALQLIAILFGLLASFLLPDLTPIEHKTSVGDPGHIEDRGWRTGYHIVANSDRLYPVVLSTIFVGIFFIGIFMVALPLIVRDVFLGGQLEIAIVNICFWGGTIFTTLVLLNRRPIRRRGRAMTIGLVVGSFALLCVPFTSNFYQLCFLVVCWGLAAGVNMVMSRTIVQIEAPVQAKSRVMALYNLGFLGAAPLGAMLTGFVSEWVGSQTATGIFAIAMLTMTAWLATFTPVLNINRHEDEA